MNTDSKGKTIFKDICLICKELKRLTTKKICYKCAIEVSTVCKEEDIVWQGRNREYGYIMAWDHPFRWKIGYVSIYKLVYEKYLTKINGIKTYIHSNVDVHHIDHNTKNNFITNLEIIPHEEHKAYHHKKGKEKILKRRCICCNNSTWKNKKGVYFWNNYENLGYLCNKCNNKFKRGVLFSKLFL
jgi:hypothetical protein